MFIMRWLAGHPIVAIWFLGLVAYLLNYDAIYNHKKTIEHTKASAEPHKIVEVEKKPIVESANVEASDVVASDNNVEKKDVVEVVTKVKKSLAENKPLAEKKIAEVVAETEAINIVEEVAPEEPKAKEEVVKKVVEKIDQPAIAMVVTSADKDADTNIEDLMQTPPGDLLLMAREAYWNNGLDEAASLYQELIKLEPNEITHKGELGNVYWRLGYPKKAAKLYSEIAIPMIETGNGVRVTNMVGFIGLFYPERATEIHRRLQH